MRTRWRVLLGAAALGWISTAAAEESAKAILSATGVQGGFIIQIGCADGRLAAAFGQAGPFLVQALDPDPGRVARARERIRALGLYGRVSVDRLRGARLPYVDNLANLVVASELGKVSLSEALRVLRPGGAAYVRRGKRWTKTVKPWPAGMDAWTHGLHDATNNAVSNDTLVGPPRHFQWIAGPRWARSHDHLASVSAVVTAGGRLFAIVDEGPTAAVALPAKWMLVARDAFNGVLLWKRSIPRWEGHLRGFRSGPPELMRSLVADKQRVFAILGYGEPARALDAATGRTLLTYEETKDAVELVLADGTLFVVTGARSAAQRAADEAAWRRGASPRPHHKGLVAVRADDGRVLWKKRDADTDELMPATLAAADGRVFFENPDAVVCVDARTGRVAWRAPRPLSLVRPGWSTPTLVVYRGVVLSADRQPTPKDRPADQRRVDWIPTSLGGHSPPGEMIAFDAKTGRRLWSRPCREGYNSPVDVLVADGLVWSGRLVRARDPGITQAVDPRTGEVRRTRSPDKTYFNIGMAHHRCYRNVATPRYLLLGRAGVAFVDLKTGEVDSNHWVRGTCQLGVVPSYGLLYAPPHSCACYIQAKLNGFNALAPASPNRPLPQGVSAEGRLERGPAYPAAAGKISNLKSQISNPQAPLPAASDWPTYRSDASRSGWSRAPAPARLRRAWSRRLGGRLTSLVEADGKVFVAQRDAHAVYALDAETGETLWRFTAGGRVDSPPTIYRGLALFGCADGWVYCLSAADGRIAWRFLAAPEDRRLVAYGQVESVWPVPGSVLVQDGAAYCVAGRSSVIEGGLFLYRLDPLTGRLLSVKQVCSVDPKTGAESRRLVRGLSIAGMLPDVLSSDGESVFMREARFDKKLEPQPATVPHVFSSVGFLDDAWWHRTYWQYGARVGVGYGGWPIWGQKTPAGRLLACDESKVYGFGRDLYAYFGSHVGLDAKTIFYFRGRDPRHRWIRYHLFASDKKLAEEALRARHRVTTACVSVARSDSLRPAGKRLTVCAWTKTSKPDGAVVARGGSSHGYALYLRRGAPAFAVRVQGKLCAARAQQKISQAWTHLAGVLTPERKLLLYVNGRLAGQAPARGFLARDPGEPMEIGADEGTGVGGYRAPLPFRGLIDEVRVYHRALSAQEIAQLAREPTALASDPALVLRYSFDRGDARDDSGHHNDASLVNVQPAPGKAGQAMKFSGRRLRIADIGNKYRWEVEAAAVVHALALAGPPGPEQRLFAAGAGAWRPPAPAKQGSMLQPAVLKPFEELAQGRGAALWTISPSDGKLLAECKLDAPPVFDGLIVARGSVFLSTTAGSVERFSR